VFFPKHFGDGWGRIVIVELVIDAAVVAAAVPLKDEGVWHRDMERLL
jgi:hypothetical protein